MFDCSNNYTKNKLADTTIKTWRHRNEIPNRYIRGYLPPQNASPEYLAKFTEFAKLRCIRPKPYVDVVPKLYDVNRGQSSLTTLEAERLKGAVDDLKQELSALFRDDRRFLDQYQKKVFAILQRKEIVVKTFLIDVCQLTTLEYNRTRAVIDGRSDGIEDVRHIDKLVTGLKFIYNKMP